MYACVCLFQARALYKNLHYGKGWIPDYCASNYILDVLAKTHDFDEAIYFFRMVQKEGVDKRLVSCRWYEHVFQACIYCGKFEMVETLFTEMLERGTLPGLGTFNHLATAYGKMGRAEDIEKLMVTMSEVGVTPQHIIYKVLMLTYIRAGRNREVRCTSSKTIMSRAIEKEGDGRVSVKEVASHY